MEWKNDFQRLDDKIDSLSEQITRLRVDVAGLKIKSGIIGGLISGAAMLIIEFFRK